MPVPPCDDVQRHPGPRALRLRFASPEADIIGVGVPLWFRDGVEPPPGWDRWVLALLPGDRSHDAGLEHVARRVSVSAL